MDLITVTMGVTGGAAAAVKDVHGPKVQGGATRLVKSLML